MIVGETIRLRHVETQIDPVTQQPAPFDVSVPSVVVTAPDGTTMSPVVSVADGNASDPENLSLVLSFLVTPVLGGLHRCVLSYQDRDGETIMRPLRFFATWTDPTSLLATRLQMTVPPETFEPEFASVAGRLLTRFPCLGNPPGSAATLGVYGGLTDPNDQAYFDEAVTLAVCARLVGPLTTGGMASDQVMRREGDTEYRFADQTRERIDERGSPGDYGAGPGGYSGSNERVRWLRESAEAMGQIPCIAQYFLARRNSFSPFALSGLTRQQKAQGSIPTLVSSVIDLFTNDYFLEQDYDNQIDTADCGV